MNNDIEKINALLTKPMFTEMTDNELKIRKNLMIISFLSIFTIYSGITVEDHIEIWGITFKDLTESKLLVALLLINLYLLVHYLWISIHVAVELRLRVRGGRNSINIYSWWLDEIKNVNDLYIPTNEVINHCERIKALSSNEAENVVLLEISTRNLIGYLKRMQTLAASNFFQKALENYDTWYKRFNNSQNIRWLVIEVGIPLILGIFSIYLILSRLFTL